MQTLNLHACGTKIHVRIDKAAQKVKTEISKFITAAPAFEYMLYYLQYGEIISCGDNMPSNNIKPGMIALFHHHIEDDPAKLLGLLDNGDELRWVETESKGMGWEICAVIDPANPTTVIPMDRFVFCIDYPAGELLPGEERVTYDHLSAQAGSGGVFNAKIVGKTQEGIYMAQNEAMIKSIEEQDIQMPYATCAKFVPENEKMIEAGNKIITECFNHYELELRENLFDPRSKKVKYNIVLREFVTGYYPNSQP